MARVWLWLAVLLAAGCGDDSSTSTAGSAGSAGDAGSADSAGSGPPVDTTCAISGTSYHLDPDNGSDSGDGSSTSPWRTLDHALASVQAGDGILLRSGTYGAFSYKAPGFSDWVTIKADAGATPVFDSLSVGSASQTITAYLRLCNLSVQQPEPNPWPADDGLRHPLGYMLTIRQAHRVEVIGAKMTGVNKYLSHGISVSSSDHVTLHHNDVSVVNDGVHVIGGNDLVFTYNHVHGMSEGSGIRFQGEMTNTLIEGNHVHGCSYSESDPYFPSNDPTAWHVGSGISIRIANATIRNNIVHDGFSQAMMFYGDNGIVYSNMLVENNLFYDSGRVHLYDVGENVVVRNNTFVTNLSKEGTGKYDIAQRYNAGCYLAVAYADGHNGSTLRVFNNVFVGGWSLPASTDAFTEDYNIFWKHAEGDTFYESGKGGHSRAAVWIGPAPDYALHGNPNFFENIGFADATPEYSHATQGVQAFFVSPGFAFSDEFPSDKGKTWDYHLAAGSPALNFGDPAQQPSGSLGSLDADGFINADGASRDASHHSAGCYE